MHAMAAWLARQPQSQVMLAMDRSQDDFDFTNIERVLLKKPEKLPQPQSVADYMAAFMRRWDKTAYSLRSLAASKPAPNIILTASSNGAAFDLQAIYPDAFIVNYLESARPFSAPEQGARNLLQSLQVMQARLAFAFSESERAALPPLLAPAIRLAPLAVDCDYFQRQATATPEGPFNLVLQLKSLPFQDFGAWLNLAIRLLRRNAGLRVAILAPNLGFIRAAQTGLASLAPAITDRILLKAWPSRATRRQLFGCADLLACPGRELNLDLLEAMSCAAPVMTAAAAPGLEPGANCLRLPSCGVATALQAAIARKGDLGAIAARGRAYVMARHALDACLPGHFQLILDAMRHKP